MSDRRPVWGQDHHVHAQRTPTLASCGALLARPLLEATTPVHDDTTCRSCWPGGVR